MVKAKLEYIKFLKMKFNNFNEYEKTLSNIIYQNFDEIQGKKSSHGHRKRLISSLILNNKMNVNEDFLVYESKTNNETVSRLDELSVENFRGFTRTEKFDLSLDYTFIYGPNGTGKTSFCEALEYSLLGSIAEANHKRIKPDDYIRNLKTNKSKYPVLKGVYKEPERKGTVKSSENYEFCFIERNRIDGFSRIAANSPGMMQQQLSILLGLDEFNQFVSHCSDTLDGYIDCEGSKGKILKEKQEGLLYNRARLEELNQEKIHVDERANKIIDTYDDFTNLDEISDYLNGVNNVSGEIKRVEVLLSNLEGRRAIELDPINNSKRLIKEINDLIINQNSIENKIMEFKNELDLSSLYQSIIKNKSTFDDTCPACESPIHKDGELNLTKDPYINAEHKIREFKEASQWEQKLENVNNDIKEDIRKLSLESSKLREISININSDLKQNLDSLHSYMTQIISSEINNEHVKKLQE